ncbi:MAG TPA: hypothetical protein VM077_05455 [Candidatus Limnocylindrales bacterium]|nr:hypothetical protein [Candidatus Limnocylindrales bacterium]
MSIIQIPNPPLIAAAVGFLIEKVSEGDIQKFGLALFISSIIVWSYQELTTGVNLFRKLLGGAVLITSLIRLFNLLP